MTTSSHATLGTINIDIGGPGSQRFKSIDDLAWHDVPGFAVLTGLNGSGKSQLLELLAYRLTSTRHPELGDLSKVNLNVTGTAPYTADEVVYIPSNWDIAKAPRLGISEIQKVKEAFPSRVRSPASSIVQAGLRARLVRVLGSINVTRLTDAEIRNNIPDDFSFMLSEGDVVSGLPHVFLAYRLRFAEKLEAGVSRDEVTKELGPAPWDLLNQTLEVGEFPYRVASPLDTKLLEPYELILEDLSSKKRIRPQDLSSGEKILFALVFWLYKSKNHVRFPRLFLLDEPDAHLHPSMTRHFMDVAKEILVEKYGVRTIITTHSPSTVAMAPEGSLFEMRRTAPRVSKTSSKASSIGLLTAGLVTVSETTKYVLAEDQDDVDFYNAVRGVLTDFGVNRDAMALKPAPTIVFLPASVGTGKGKIGGGKSVVEGWVNKFDTPPFDSLIHGIIDRDQGNTGSNRIRVLARHSLENYLLDPFVVYGLLLSIGKAPMVASSAITTGNEHLIRDLPLSSLADILNSIRTPIETDQAAKNNVLDVTPKPVSFTNGKAIDYPAWMLDYRGHDLLKAYQDAFNAARTIIPPSLTQMFQRVRLIPVELANILHAIQK